MGAWTLTLETDVLKVLKNGKEYRICQIQQKLKEKPEYKNHDKRGLEASIARVLARLDEKVCRQSRSGHVFYSIRREARPKVENALYKHDMVADISKEDLDQAKIARETIDRAWSVFEDARYAKAIKKAGLLDMAQIMMKFSRGEWRFFKEAEVEEEVRRFSEAFDIGLSYPKGEMPPQIPDWAYWLLAHITFASQGFPEHVEKFKIILSFDASRIKQRQSFDEKAFVQWLKKFKKEDISTGVLEYLKRPELRNELTNRSVPSQKSFLTEANKYMEYNIEFTQKESAYMTMTKRLLERLLKEDPVLFQKYVSNKRFSRQTQL